MFSISRVPSREARRKVRIALVAAVGGVALVAGPTVLATLPTAQADSRVTVANEFGKAEADLTYSTSITVTGKGFQSVKGGFGGLYVTFGAVNSDRWKPSQGGTTGNGDYEYVPDSEAKDNGGFQKFVAFPGSDTASAANGGVLKADGSWSTTLTIPGSSFEAVDRDGKIHTVDCKVAKCGIITVGAHGVISAKNETFTPVKFANIFDAANAPNAGTEKPVANSETTKPETSSSDDGALDPDVAAAVTVDRESAYPGRALTFTGTGFMEGEQVVAILDDGIVAVGPTVVGRGGGVAGIIALPAETAAGTHTVRLVAASSGRSATVSFPVRIDVVVAPDIAAAPVAAESSWPAWLPSWPVLVVLFIALAAFGTAVWLKFRRRARNAKAATNRNLKTSGQVPPAPRTQNRTGAVEVKV